MAVKKVQKKKIVEREIKIDNDWNFTVEDFNKNAIEKTKNVLEEFKNTVRFKVEKYSLPYDESEYAGLFMVYSDYETDAELETRLQYEDQLAKMIEQRDRKKFETLSKKFNKQ